MFGPFGELIRATGPMAKANPLRFSTKYQDDETDLLYYGYRYYNALTGRWLNRDPIGERGGRNLYAFGPNNPVDTIDPLGLSLADGTFGGGIGGPLLKFCQAAKDRTCNNAVGANVLLQLKLEGIDGNDDPGGGNAFRHCLAACQSAKTCGEESAKRFWNGREDGSTASGRQDLDNNAIGFGNASQSSCWDACMKSWNGGGLRCGTGPCPPRPSRPSTPPSLPPFPGPTG
jgi:RHS repeat-associated protein